MAADDEDELKFSKIEDFELKTRLEQIEEWRSWKINNDKR